MNIVKSLTLFGLFLVSSCTNLTTSNYVLDDNLYFNANEDVVSITVNGELIAGDILASGHHVNIKTENKIFDTDPQRIYLVSASYTGGTLEGAYRSSYVVSNLISNANNNMIPGQNYMIMTDNKSYGTKDENGNVIIPVATNILTQLDFAIDKMNNNEIDLLVFHELMHGYASYYNSEKYPDKTSNTNDVSGAYNKILCMNGTYICDYDLWNRLKKIKRGRFFGILESCHTGTMWYNAKPRHDYSPDRNSDIYENDDLNMLIFTSAPDDGKGYFSLNEGGFMILAMKKAMEKNNYHITYSELWNYVKENTYNISALKDENCEPQMFIYGNWKEMFEKKNSFR